MINQNVDSGTPAIIDLTGQLNLDEKRGVTVDRLIIDMVSVDIAFDGVEALSQMDIGIGVGEDDAFNVNALPDPNSRDDRPAMGWMWRTRVMQVTGATWVKRAVFRGDMKSSRKLNGGVLYLHGIQGDIIATATNRLIGIIRTHYLLP